MRKCTIRGVYPALILGRLPATSEDRSTVKLPELPSEDIAQYEKKPWNFCPEARFWVGNTNHPWWPFGETITLHCGGWAIGSLSLYAMYLEHLYSKNRWSVSNCGFDLAKYRGTTFYLPQHATIDYIFFYDSEYQDLDKFLEHTDLHPLLLITHPQTILIKSKNRAGPRRTRKVYIPRPAWWPSGWSDMRNIAKTGLFCYFIMAIDLDNPWIGKYQNPYDGAHGAWWTDQKWLTKWNEYVRTPNNNQSTSFRIKQYSSNDMANVRSGPFILKSWKMEHPDYIYPQITIFYKSYWTWGGRSLSIKTVCDPNKPLSSE